MEHLRACTIQVQVNSLYHRLQFTQACTIDYSLHRLLIVDTTTGASLHHRLQVQVNSLNHRLQTTVNTGLYHRLQFTQACTIDYSLHRLAALTSGAS
ncbi:hypothetical protein DPMN_015024 [Dreissena polymorpha]|uniref:Uncharacterized protein n=1 Tax=Dreissena polymorpha TaxID=45954 RepID=A0A9D4NAR8_DREPO|nr:hypothetical protein DPMN_015024 [Dreissena polymorpha]